MRKFVTLESLRAYMAWWVVLSHAAWLSGLYGTMHNRIWTIFENNQTPVQVFIVLSGFVITHLCLTKDEPYRQFILRRGFRIVPVYLVCLALAMLTLGCQNHVFTTFPWLSERYGPQASVAMDHFGVNLASHLLLLHGVVPDAISPNGYTAFLGPGWSLSLEWQFYLVAPLMTLLIARGNWLVALATTYAMILAGRFSASHLFPLALELKPFLPMAFGYFAVGILSRRALGDRSIARPFWDEGRPSIMICAAIGAIMLTTMDLIVAVIWTAFLLLAVTEQSRGGDRLTLGRWITDAGKRSYSTYLVHSPIYFLALWMTDRWFGHATRLPLVIAMAVCQPLVYYASVLLNRHVESRFVRIGSRLTGTRPIVDIDADDRPAGSGGG